MKSQNNIPATKVERATRFVTTGIKVGGNYIKHYAKKAINPDLSRDELHESNAADIYETLSELKGSALKVAQMMSMDRNLLPKAYSERFQMAQYSAPPLSGPLVIKTFTRYFGKAPQALFDTFAMDASNAASIGQVHQATKNGKKLAVKIQYPGVAQSVKSDLKMVKPFAVRLMNLNEKDVDKYMDEVETKLLEETDYQLELQRSQEISTACGHINGLVFPTYYPEFSSERVLTMDWLEGFHLDDFLKTNPSQEVRNKIGQALWDFYDFQVHILRKVHADPHPGNFLMRPDGTMGVIDFGCVKEIPENYYRNYFTLINPDNLKDPAICDKVFVNLEFLHEQDTPQERKFYSDLFITMIGLLGKPFHTQEFDFGDDAYFQSIYDYAEYLSNLKELRESKVARGSKDSLYINRTYYGLYSMLNQLKAVVRTSSPAWLWQPI
ncbi:AarF/ABC1/UbiB kinase family protein [Cytophagaceae bacterium DM2B3-1]|uniref:AarF/ABC1/UbiB kinase family protein n=2 Tax=Xanthocytophaga TaxID=3078918 RepID=A0AAE3QW73_9BACT|nr:MULTISPECIES: AarF/ABC1/UbiB kinase family protein [Xanthocytophaga]MDJ1472458.1 AarF/ABC1/UbiB kinase family protein [Xanthocytophaga flavus]MDJ1483653.1 AarF/ABC1/UbiB kinase family protein [Xanthocytophaga flavus]MDJ1497820.1 AarF/ABC1/UbiB kinase family protein [Xanthocytophaga flavus]MDJ1499382.1 AarF/ABC1/UbiB kinase family protein [Xanthocytophaga agilis]